MAGSLKIAAMMMLGMLMLASVSQAQEQFQAQEFGGDQQLAAMMNKRRLNTLGLGLFAGFGGYRRGYGFPGFYNPGFVNNYYGGFPGYNFGGYNGFPYGAFQLPQASAAASSSPGASTATSTAQGK